MYWYLYSNDSFGHSAISNVSGAFSIAKVVNGGSLQSIQRFAAEGMTIHCRVYKQKTSLHKKASEKGIGDTLAYGSYMLISRVWSMIAYCYYVWPLDAVYDRSPLMSTWLYGRCKFRRFNKTCDWSSMTMFLAMYNIKYTINQYQPWNIWHEKMKNNFSTLYPWHAYHIYSNSGSLFLQSQ